MHVLYIVSVAVWFLIAFRALKTLLHIKDSGLTRPEIVVVTILLLSGLNICRGSLAALFGQQEFIPGQKLVEYFYIGSSVFQILLSSFVLKYLKKTN